MVMSAETGFQRAPKKMFIAFPGAAINVGGAGASLALSQMPQ
jgi:hypothetical protein